MFRSRYQIFLALSLLTALLAALPGCGSQSDIRPYSPYQYHPQGMSIPERSHYGFARISDDEALRISRSLAPRAQGMNTYMELAPGIERSLRYMAKKSDSEVAVDHPELRITYGDLRASLQKLQTLLPQLGGNPELLAREFDWYALGPTVHFTGYFEPTLEASWERTSEFIQPLYALPKDVRQGKPYHNRWAIDEEGVLAGRGLELAWIRSKVDSFFLQIQGSGRLVFTDGQVKHVLYAGKNNQAYVALGRVLKERGLIPADQVNMRSIRDYLDAHPSEVPALLAENPSYVFFRLADSGPLGAMGQVLTPWSSLAVDKRVIPLGAPLIFSVPLPDANHVQGAQGILSGIGFAQDVGGAIKGQRADLFCGPGNAAELIAGHLDTNGDVIILLAR